MRNYAAHAEKCLVKQIEELKKEKNKDFDIDEIQEIANGISRAKHFELPDNGKILDDDFRGMRDQELRLPFKEITIEYDIDWGIQETESVDRATKMLIYATEIDCLNESDERLKKLILENNLQDQKTIILLHACYGTPDKNFILTSMGAVLQTNWNNKLDPTKQFRIKNLQSKVGMEIYFIPYVLKTIELEVLKESDTIKKAGEAEINSFLAQGVINPIVAVIELCEALTCKNVSFENINEEDKKLNQRRIRDGKIPFYETKVLTINTQENNNKKTNEIPSYNKNGPRQHLRRGHIRRLQTGVNVWVNSCIVGSGKLGKIDKTYKVN